MINRRIAAAFAAGTLAVGILVGSAGTIVLRDATAPQALTWSTQMTQAGSMVSMMGGAGMMGGSAGTLNGPGSMMNGQNGTGPAASALPEWMQQHHGTASPVPGR